MTKKWIVEVKGGWKQSRKNYKEFDLKLQNTKVFHWWDYSKNIKRPENYPPQSNFKAWFKCDIGHSFQSRISGVFLATKKASGGCSSCGSRIKSLKNDNNLENKYPKIAKLWKHKKNIGSPKDYPPRSSYNAWWNCSNCNSSFQKRIDSVTKSHNLTCFKCDNFKKNVSLINKYPKIIKNNWDFQKNNRNPKNISSANIGLYWWKCLIHGSVKASIKRAIKNNFCEKCTTVSRTSEIEIRIYLELKTIFEDVINQKIIKKREIDIFLPKEKIAVEFDGYPWHLKNEKKDLVKNEILEREKIKVIRIRDERLVNHMFSNEIIFKSSEYMQPLKIIIKLLLKLKTMILDKHKIKKINKYISNNKLINEKEYNKIRAKFSLADTDRSLSKLKEIIKYFDYDKNFPLTPKHFTFGSHHKAWWLCENNHSKLVKINEFERSSFDKKNKVMKCERCRRESDSYSSDIKKGWRYNYIDIYNEVDRLKNKKKIRPDWSPNSEIMVWWSCKKKHSWQSRIKERTLEKIKNCPVCDPASWSRASLKHH